MNQSGESESAMQPGEHIWSESDTKMMQHVCDTLGIEFKDYVEELSDCTDTLLSSAGIYASLTKEFSARDMFYFRKRILRGLLQDDCDAPTKVHQKNSKNSKNSPHHA